MAKCLWNPNYDANRAMNEFLAGYYGQAARPIRAYIDLLHDYAERKHIHVRLYTTLDSPHLTDEPADQGQPAMARGREPRGRQAGRLASREALRG